MPATGIDLVSLRLPSSGAVTRGPDGLYRLVDDAGRPVEPVEQFLRDFVARGNRVGSGRSYAYALLRWWRFLEAVAVPWDRATTDNVRDYALWLRIADKAPRHTRTSTAALRGTVNPATGKAYLDDRYKPRTIRHGVAVLWSFYDFWVARSDGPLINPVVLERRADRRNAHHDPEQPFSGGPAVRYGPAEPQQLPRSLSDARWAELFAALRSHRDRALLSLTVCSGARASEILGLRPVDVNWGDQLIRVVRKGTRAEQWLPVSAEAMIWLRLYLVDRGTPLDPASPLWITLRRRDRGWGQTTQPLSYDTLRAVFRRVNADLGTNWSMHDLRHTAAIRMHRDPTLTLRDVQIILGHRHIDTTATSYLIEDALQVALRVRDHLDRRKDHPGHDARDAAAPHSTRYRDDDLRVLFGGENR